MVQSESGFDVDATSGLGSTSEGTFKIQRRRNPTTISLLTPSPAVFSASGERSAPHPPHQGRSNPRPHQAQGMPLRRRPALLWVRGWNFRNARQPVRVESRIRTCAHSGTQCGAFGLASRHSESGHCRKSEPCPGSTRGFGVGTPGLAPREPPRARDPSHWHRRHRSGLDPGPLSHPGPAAARPSRMPGQP